MKFLIIRLSSFGDIVLTTPVMRCLKKQHPQAEIHYLTRPAYAEVLQANPYMDRLHLAAPNLHAILPELQSEQFDAVIDLHHNLNSLRVKKYLGKPAHAFHKLNIEKWLRTALKIDLLPELHIVDRYLNTLRSFGVQNDGAGLDYFIPVHDQVRDTDIPVSHQAGYVGVVIGAALNTKKMPAATLQQLCKRIDYPVILLGGPEDRETGEGIAAADPVKIYNACGKFRFNESADLVRRSRLIVTHDTGLMHVAAAFKKPVVSIWGNTIPEFGMYPYYGDNYLKQVPQPPYDLIQVDHLFCRPCSKIGYRRCPLGHFQCMKRQDVDFILGRIHQRLGK